MKLIELVNYFRNGRAFEEFCQDYSLNPESGGILVYMAKPFSIDNDLAFLEIEDTNDSIAHNFNGIEYFNLFDFYYFQDVIEDADSANNLSLSDATIAKRLYDYAINNA